MRDTEIHLAHKNGGFHTLVHAYVQFLFQTTKKVKFHFRKVVFRTKRRNSDFAGGFQEKGWASEIKGGFNNQKVDSSAAGSFKDSVCACLPAHQNCTRCTSHSMQLELAIVHVSVSKVDAGATARILASRACACTQALIKRQSCACSHKSRGIRKLIN